LAHGHEHAPAGKSWLQTGANRFPALSVKEYYSVEKISQTLALEQLPKIALSHAGLA